MSPAEAEFEAKRLGLEPLASAPDPNDYDPMREPFWTLPMTVASTRGSSSATIPISFGKLLTSLTYIQTPSGDGSRLGLSSVDDRRPALIHGGDLIEFLDARQARRKQKCATDELYCFRCRRPRHPRFRPR